MTTTEFKAPPELKCAVLTALLRIKEEHNEVPAASVREAVTVLGCSERTVWRWLKRGSVPDLKRSVWAPKDEYRSLLLRAGGSIKELNQELVASGKETVGPRTMQRGFSRELGTVQLTFARNGFKAAQGQLPTSAMPDRAVNDEWSMDDTQLPVWCILPSGEIGKPQLQGIMDACTRYIVSLNLSPYHFNTEDAVENLANAMVGHYSTNNVFIGGKPRALRTDRGSIFVTRATSLGLIASDIERRHSAPYTPQQNGKIERWHRFKRLFKKVPGFDWSDYKQGDPRKAAEVPPLKELLTFEEVVAEAARIVRGYNTKRVHKAHKMTPEACWEHEVAANPNLVVAVDAVAVRAAMVQSKDRLLRRGRVEWETRIYVLHPQSVLTPDEDSDVIDRRRRLIDATEGKHVNIKFLQSRVEHVSVYTRSNEYLGDAVWDKIQTIEQVGEISNRRRQHIKTMTLDIENIAHADAEAVAARRKEILDSMDAGDAVYDQYDDTDDGNDAVESGPVGDPTPGRKSRTKKATTTKTSKKTGAKNPPGAPTARQRAEERRRAEVKEAADWRRDLTG